LLRIGAIDKRLEVPNISLILRPSFFKNSGKIISMYFLNLSYLYRSSWKIMKWKILGKITICPISWAVESNWDKKIGWASPVSGCYYDFLVNFFKPNNSFLGQSQPPLTTPCPVFLSGNNWILNWSHYQLLPILPRKNFFWNICFFL
jgi:hypothetical protein